MRETLIILVLILNYGCTAKRFITERSPGHDEESSERVIDEVKKNNLSEDSFFIEKGDFLLTNNNKTTRFIFSGKFEKPDKFLFSLRNITGIEGARVYLTKDTVLINDRIQKRLLYGKPENLEKIIGLPYFIINVAFGDLLMKEDNGKYESERITNTLVLTQHYNGGIWKYVLDVNIGKVKSINFSSKIQNEAAILEYSKFGINDKHIPGIIEMKDNNRNIRIKIRLIRVKVPWDGKIEFIPGSGYTKEEIK